MDAKIINQLREAEEKATNGPWASEGRAVYFKNGDMLTLLNLALDDKEASADSKFIALSRNSLKQLLNEREELVKALEKIASGDGKYGGSQDVASEVLGRVNK